MIGPRFCFAVASSVVPPYGVPYCYPDQRLVALPFYQVSDVFVIFASFLAGSESWSFVQTFVSPLVSHDQAYAFNWSLTCPLGLDLAFAIRTIFIGLQTQSILACFQQRRQTLHGDSGQHQSCVPNPADLQVIYQVTGPTQGWLTLGWLLHKT